MVFKLVNLPFFDTVERMIRLVKSELIIELQILFKEKISVIGG